MAHGFTPAQPGSVSHGTLRKADLFRAFGNFLHEMIQEQLKLDLTKDQTTKLLDLQNQATYAQTVAYILDNDVEEDKIGIDLGEDLASLTDDLDLFSPSFHYFGANEGDASDFGYWPNEED